VAYKLGDFKKAMQMYSKEMEMAEADEEVDDLATNVMACGANDLDLIDMVQQLTNSNIDENTQFEQSFNLSLLQFK
jgi:hypothetical protein